MVLEKALEQSKEFYRHPSDSGEPLMIFPKGVTLSHTKVCFRKLDEPVRYEEVSSWERQTTGGGRVGNPFAVEQPKLIPFPAYIFLKPKHYQELKDRLLEI